MVLDESNQPVSVERFASGTLSGPVDIQFGPDGALYYLAFRERGLLRISYVGGSNRQPVARASVEPDNGEAPLEVTSRRIGIFRSGRTLADLLVGSGRRSAQQSSGGAQTLSGRDLFRPPDRNRRPGRVQPCPRCPDRFRQHAAICHHSRTSSPTASTQWASSSISKARASIRKRESFRVNASPGPSSFTTWDTPIPFWVRCKESAKEVSKPTLTVKSKLL